MGFVSFVFAYMEAGKNIIYAQLTDTLSTEVNALITIKYRIFHGLAHLRLRHGVRYARKLVIPACVVYLKNQL